MKGHEAGPYAGRGAPAGRRGVLGGRQISPEKARVAGLTPVLCCHPAAGMRWIPFLGAGAGMSETDIGSPDWPYALNFI